MKYLANLVRRIGGWGMAVGAVALVAMMVLIVTSVILRRAGQVVPGTYELSELLVVVTVAFALGYAALEKRHIVVNIVVARFPQRAQAILAAVMSFIALATWAAVAWTGFIIVSKRWLGEDSEMLSIPFLPFRLIFLFGLILFCLVYLIDMIKALRQAVKK
jgi:TRAP-type C4-dicarboxylate transport system permease small subunit